jgi:DNA helicase MCM9
MMAVQRQGNLEDEETQCYAVFQSFLDEKHEREMAGILLYEDADACYSVVVNSLELFDSNIEVSQLLISNPRKMLPICHQALRECLRLLYEEHRLVGSMKLKKNAFVRLSNLPTCPELTRKTIPRSSDIGRLLAFTGKFTVIFETGVSTGSPQ